MSCATLKLRAFEGNRDDGLDCTCNAEVDVDIDVEPPDPNYGADRDGNRGVYMPGSVGIDQSAPDKCPECGYEYTKEEKQQIEDDWNEQLQKQVESNRRSRDW